MSMGSTENRRRYTRQSVRQKAHLRVARGTVLSCEIGDFCFGGLFVKKLQGTGIYDSRDVRPGTRVSVLFKRARGSDSFELGGHVAHVSKGGVGVAFFDGPSMPAIMALQDQVESPGGDGPAERRKYGAKVAYDKLARICRLALESLLGPVLEDFFQKVDAAFMDAADKAHNTVQQAACLHATALLKSRRRDIEAGFRERVLRQTEGFVAPSVKISESPGGSSELSLVDTAEFEDWLNLSEMMEKIEGTHEHELQRIEGRFSRLADQEVNRTNNPYGPGVIGHSFRDALQDLPLANDEKRLIYGAFGHALDPRLSDLYQRLDEAMRYVVPDGPGRVGGTDSVRDRPSPPSSKRPVETEHPPRVYTSVSRPTPYAAARTLLSLYSHPAGQRDTDDKAGWDLAIRDTQSIISALRRLQARKVAQHVDYLETPSLEVELAGILSPSGEMRKVLAEEHRQTIEILGSLLDKLVTQDWISQGMKPYVQALQIPLMEAALADPELIHGASHPARDVVNLLDQLTLATNARGEIESDHLRQALAAIAERIVGESVDNPAVFGEAKVQLEQLVAPLLRARATRIGRLQESCEAEHRVEVARGTVSRAIDARIGGKTVPTLLLQLLDTGWRQLLVLTVLREGVASKAWSEGIAVVDRLLEWLPPGGSAGPAPTRDARRLIASVDEQLWTVCVEPALHNRIILELTALLVGRSDTGERKPPKFSFVPPPGEVRDETAAQHAARARLAAFKVGDWLDFTLASGARSSLRLSWIGESPDRYVFADYRGCKQLELSAVEFVNYLDEHRATMVEDRELPLLERATGLLVQDMLDKLRFQATHDAVTGLINRKEFVRQLRASFGAAGPAVHLMGMVDLVQLRVINNLCGMEAGDRLLKEICVILRSRFPDARLLGRMGDSSFGVLFGVDSQEQTLEQGAKLLREIAGHHFKWGERSFTLAANLGMATRASDEADPEALLRDADAACMAAKQKGPNRLQIYAADDVSLEAQKHMLDWAGRIDSLLAEGRMFVRCQMIAPIFPDRDAHSHYEILLGVRNEQGQVVSPFDFVMAAERWNRITEIDRWQVQSVFGWIREHRSRFDAIGGFSINLSGQSVNSGSFLEFLHAELARGDLPAEKITFEITETSAIGEFGHAGQFIRQIKRHGCRFSLDDFGTGFSSYAYLKNLQVDYLKIDGSFVRDLASSGTDYALVKSMNEIGHSLGMKTIAEYVENDDIMHKLSEIGVDYAQGYAVGKPSALTELLVSEATVDLPDI